MKIIRFTLWLFFSVWFLTACEIIFEKDIEDEAVLLLSPSNETISSISTQTFWWEQIEGATTYRLQIVMADFENADRLVVDTLLNNDKFKQTLLPGIYQWRVRAENSAYMSKWSYANLKLISTDDLTEQHILLKKPAPNNFTNQNVITFEWDTILNVNTYQFQVYKDEWNQMLIIDSTAIPHDKNKISIHLNQNELWYGVKAINDHSQSKYSVQRLIIDRTKPEQPVLIKPENNLVTSDTTLTFEWNSSDSLWNFVHDSLYIYKKINENESRLYYKGNHTEKYFTYKLNRNNSYEWHVVSIDKANNKSKLSAKYYLKIN